MPAPAVIAAVAAIGASILPLVIRVIAGLGIGVATYTGISAVWDNAQAGIWTNLGGASASVLTILGMARVDDAIKVVLSAGSTILLLKGFSAATGIVTKWRAGPNPGAFSNV
jgi:Protein of unknown function (DUF2523)